MANIKVSVKAFPVLKDFVDVSLEEGSTLSDLVDYLSRMYDEFRENYLDDNGSLDVDVVVMVNNKPVRDMSLVLSDGDKVYFIPPVAGG